MYSLASLGNNYKWYIALDFIDAQEAAVHNMLHSFQSGSPVSHSHCLH